MQLYLNLINITGENDVDINQKTGFTATEQRYGMAGRLGRTLQVLIPITIHKRRS